MKIDKYFHLYSRKDDVVFEEVSFPERKKGKWIEQDDAWDGVYYECSCCKDSITLIDGTPADNLYNFCPNCGADMRGEEDGRLNKQTGGD